jgi:hypothetical protein
MVAGLFAGHLLKAINKFDDPEWTVLRGKLVESIPAFFASCSDMTLGATLFITIPPAILQGYEGADICSIYHGLVTGLTGIKYDAATRKNAFAFLISIIGRVPLDAVRPEPLFNAISLSFRFLPFDVTFLAPLLVCANAGVSLDLFVNDNHLNILTLFSILNSDEQTVLAIMRKITGSELVVDRLQGVLDVLKLAACGLAGLNSASPPYSLEVLGLLSRVAVSVKNSTEKAPVEFVRLIVQVLAAATEVKTSDTRDLAFETLQILVT